VRKFLAWLADEKASAASPNTAAYCKARQRLSLKLIKGVHENMIRKTKHPNKNENWYGRRVRVIDGSAVSMPDTPANQQMYPQSTRQKPGCGFPIMRIVAMFCLHSGTMTAMAKDALDVSESVLFRRLWSVLKPNDVALADRGLCSYAHFYFLAKRGVDCVMRNNKRRTVGLTPIKRFGKGDRLVEWHKSKVYPKWPEKKKWDAMPERMIVREITFTITEPGFRSKRIIVVTTLTDPKAFPARAFPELYLRRWRAELYLRDIKVTMGMDILSCKSPQMVEKELWMRIIAYNLVRTLMLEAARAHGVSCERISFKGTISTLQHWAPALNQAHLDENKRRALYEMMIYYHAKHIVPHRPNRREQRARKRRPKQYQSLTMPRHIFKEIPHRNKYKKA
jgi:hypothetical protein